MLEQFASQLAEAASQVSHLSSPDGLLRHVQETKREIHGKQTTVNHLLQSYTADSEEVKKIDEEIISLKRDLENHRREAEKAHTYYVEVTKSCKAEWEEMEKLEAKSTLNDSEKERFAVLRNGFNLVISADYQMA